MQVRVIALNDPNEVGHSMLGSSPNEIKVPNSDKDRDRKD